MAPKKSVKKSKKTTGKTTVVPAKVPQPHGGALNAGGTPGNKGGRPPDEWKKICRELASGEDVLAEAKRVIRRADHPAWLGAWKFLSEQGYGKPQDHLEISVSRDDLGIMIQELASETLRAITDPRVPPEVSALLQETITVAWRHVIATRYGGPVAVIDP